jgi:ribosomal protein S7
MTRKRELTAKYKIIRKNIERNTLTPNNQLLCNTFISDGKKATAQHHIFRAFQQIRYRLRRPPINIALTRLQQQLKSQFALVHRRKSKEMLAIPVPTARLNASATSRQLLSQAISNRTERDFSESFSQEISGIVVDLNHSTRQAFNNKRKEIFTQKINMGYR